MNSSLFDILLLDVSIWLGCLIALCAFARLSMSHPATVYLGFHAFLVTFRGVAILNGAPTAFAWPGADPVMVQEIVRAVWVCDLALVTMTIAWIAVAHRAGRSSESPLRFSAHWGEAWHSIGIRPAIIWGVSAVAIPAGCIAILLWSRLPGVVPHEISGGWSASSWVVIAQTWAGLSVLALIYWYGFRLSLVVPLCVYLAIVLYQGNYRFRLLIPLVLLTQVYLDRRGRRWPKPSGWLLLSACVLMFFPLKDVGQRLQAGVAPAGLLENVREGIATAARGYHADEMILDEFASALSLADSHGKLYWGSTYLGLLTVAVPRQLWPEKPGLTDFEKEISTAARPMAADGMTVTMLGEFYLNFSYVGVVAMSFALAWFTGNWFHAAYCRSYFSLSRFVYLLVACNLLQVYRDGLSSLFVFTVINMMPLTAIAAIHLLRHVTTHPSYREPILRTPRVRFKTEA